MIIAAKTGQGKTLCFGIPILDILIRKLQKADDAEFDTIRGLIMSPTRELAIQIKDHIEAVVPNQYGSKIKVCAIVGGMSVQKQIRLLKFKPTIIVATPGRLWELMQDHMNPYLLEKLPLIDVLVLDEADRMIADGHFKELRHILAHVYTRRVHLKTKHLKKEEENKLEILNEIFEAEQQPEPTYENIEGIDWSKVKDVYENDDVLEQLKVQGIETEENPTQKKKNNKKLEMLEREEFDKAYQKAGGIQHIICSATLTIDNKGRVTPRGQELAKRNAMKAKLSGKEISEKTNTVEEMGKILKFRSKQPKVIDLTTEERMPETLSEYAFKCTKEDKDLYLYYFLNQKHGESTVVFCNSIQCTKRVASILEFLKIPNQCLHSKMQQRQRLKNLERFKRGVQAIEDSPVEIGGKKQKSQPHAVLVCTDVAARGLDIPNVQNVVHYQCPFNAEIYVHRCGRTARIGKSGESLNLLAADDERSFRTICQVLKKPLDAVQMLDIKYANLELLKQVVKSAQELESHTHRQVADDKAATWLIKQAKEADLVLDDALKVEINQKLSGKKRTFLEQQGEDLQIFGSLKSEAAAKERNRAAQRATALKQQFEKDKRREITKKFANSSYLTPESISYLNDAAKKLTSKVDQELVYAGLHSENVAPKKFKRTEKKKQRYKGRTKRSQHKPSNRRA